VKFTVERGNPEEAIIEHAASADNTLIAMATHGRSGVKRWLLGSIAEKVLRGGKNPLLLVRADEAAKVEGEAAVESIIVPLDGSELAETVLPVVVEWSKALRLKVVLFRAYELPAAVYYGRESYLPDYEGMKAQFREQAGDYLEAKAKSLRAQGVDKVSFELVEGEGADEIAAYARKNPQALVAMCTHGRSGIRRWVLGSVTEKVVRHSGNPVLVVRGR
jgi:nucleotide-binding universal stress UspA family protein